MEEKLFMYGPEFIIGRQPDVEVRLGKPVIFARLIEGETGGICVQEVRGVVIRITTEEKKIVLGDCVETRNKKRVGNVIADLSGEGFIYMREASETEVRLAIGER